MRLVVQRVTSSSVSTEAGGVIGAISKGLCVLIGIKEGDGPNEMEWLVLFSL
jgi:D-aminoacyl-tRNA deacylase